MGDLLRKALKSQLRPSCQQISFVIVNQGKTDIRVAKKKKVERKEKNLVTAVINIVGKQNITFNFRRNYFGCNFCISLRMCVSILPCRCNPRCHFDVIISNVEYNSHFSVMAYPLSADDHNQHLRRNGFKIKTLFRMPQVS